MTGPGHPYQYVVLRAVPRVDRGECVNVGVVRSCQRAEVLACAWRVDAAKLRALRPEVDVEGLEASLLAVDKLCQGIATPGSPPPGPPGPLFGWLAAPRSTVLQPGSIHAGITSDPAAELEALLAACVWWIDAALGNDCRTSLQTAGSRDGLTTEVYAAVSR